MKKLLIAFGIVASASILIGAYFWMKPVSSLQNRSADATVTANQLIDAFDSDEASANDQFLGNVVEVTGTVSEIIKNDDGSTQVILSTDNLMGSISCNFTADQSDFEADVESYKGQNATIKGECTGYLMDVVLQRCVLINFSQ